ncbi:DNA (cytosine-5-)-methyltransferase [Mollicutes bacterium LVI A0039]|nr:DNA (cytosine-5-)-methyltransferase [Mollicutes bacterium LVI A0039]
MNINLFECFAGVGSQHTALKNIARKDDEINLVGISEWDMYAVIAYYRINNYNFQKEAFDDKTDEEIKRYLSELPYSLDSKKLTTRLTSQPIDMLRKLYEAHQKLGNIPDINGLSGKDIISRDVNLLTYSFPCQDLSNAGHRRGMKKGNETRSGLLWQVERVLEEVEHEEPKHLPKYLLMENVTAIVDKDHIEDYNSWKQKLSELGYTSYDGILDAEDFGIPQTRKRFFCLSVLQPKISRDSTDLNILLKPYKSKEKSKLKNFLRVDYKNKKYKLEADIAVPNHTKSRLQMFEKEKRLSTCITKPPKFSDKVENEYCVHDISTRTLTTKQDRWNNGGMLEYYEYKFNETELVKDVSKDPNGYSKFRLLTNRETFLLMGFKEEQIERLFEENLSSEKLYRQAGNSIVVNILEAIFKGLIQEEEDYEIK